LNYHYIGKHDENFKQAGRHGYGALKFSVGNRLQRQGH